MSNNLQTFISGILLPAVSGRKLAADFVVKGCLLLLLTLCLAYQSRAQVAEVTISVTSFEPARVRVEGRLTEERRVWTFLDEYAGTARLSERVSALEVLTADGAVVPVVKQRAGEFVAERAAKVFKYEMNLSPPEDTLAAAHISWLMPTRGVLMLQDILPRSIQRACLRLLLPQDWKTVSLEAKSAVGCFDIRDINNSIIWLGRQTRETQGRGRSLGFTLAIEGSWAFGDEDVAKSVSNILREHEASVGETPLKKSLVIIAPFPKNVDAQRWGAETRGGTVLLLSGKLPAKTAALSSLSLALVHELFHLWVPNGLALSGSYDWFYEGFTLYQATRVGVKLGYLSFQEYLGALARAYDNFAAQAGSRSESLVEASRQRWRGAEILVYNKGFVVALLCDLAIRRRHESSRTLDDVYRELFRQQRVEGSGSDGTLAAQRALTRFIGDASLVSRFLNKSEQFDLSAELAPYGLTVERAGTRTSIRASLTLKTAQYDFLKQLGYNGKAGRP
ncbi:MAG: hypothetical protein H0T45_04570 [Pyrinomonadaceae bacterium]|nr:hypothetical protein [Pyrinomonadaceae bacterium]